MIIVISDDVVNAIDSAVLHYRRLYAKQSVVSPKNTIRSAEPPRQLEAAKEFWKTLDQTSKAFSNGDSTFRWSIISAARLLIQRNGPETSRLYFGECQESVQEVVRGLTAIEAAPVFVPVLTGTAGSIQLPN